MADENGWCVKKIVRIFFSPLVGNFISNINWLFMTYELKTRLELIIYNLWIKNKLTSNRIQKKKLMSS